jgi:hypothetical protein
VASIAMSVIGTSGLVWTAFAVHAVIGIFLLVRILQWRAPIRAKPWNEVALAGRVFYIPATVVGTGRRLRASLNQRAPFPGDDGPADG